jgi:hypothetical protein
MRNIKSTIYTYNNTPWEIIVMYLYAAPYFCIYYRPTFTQYNMNTEVSGIHVCYAQTVTKTLKYKDTDTCGRLSIL